MRTAARAGQSSELEALLDFQMHAAGLPPWEAEFQFHPRRKWRADRGWPHLGLLVEVEGGIYLGNRGRHTNPVGFEQDAEKYNEAAILGYRVLRVTRKMIEDGRALDMIMRALGAS